MRQKSSLSPPPPLTKKWKERKQAKRKSRFTFDSNRFSTFAFSPALLFGRHYRFLGLRSFWSATLTCCFFSTGLRTKSSRPHLSLAYLLRLEFFPVYCKRRHHARKRSCHLWCNTCRQFSTPACSLYTQSRSRGIRSGVLAKPCQRRESAHHKLHILGFVHTFCKKLAFNVIMGNGAFQNKKRTYEKHVLDNRTSCQHLL